MNRQQQIDRFSLALHRVAVERLRGDPGLLAVAAQTLGRWRQRNGSTRSDAYLDRWQRLLDGGVDAVAQVALADDDDGATMRSVSPLGAVVPQALRSVLLRDARA